MGNIKNMRSIPLEDQKSDDTTDHTNKEGITPSDTGEVPAKIVPDNKQDNKAPRASRLKAELQAEEAKLEAELKPHREYHDKHVNDPKYLESRAKIKEISRKLGAVKNELAALARTSGTNVAMKVEPGVIGTKG